VRALLDKLGNAAAEQCDVALSAIGTATGFRSRTSAS
jgi:hypothetical protein